jgi:DNA-binding transcriptional LysR family regulator
MNIRQLEIIWAVMKSGSTIAAAELLGVSQPAVSKMLRHAEDQLGFQLFQRAKGRLWPTEEARVLAQDIEPIFLLVRSARQRAQDLKDGTTGDLRIVATPSMGHSLVPEALNRFLATRPRLRAQVDIRRTENLVQMIEYNLADVGISLSIPPFPQLITRPIHMGRMLCVMPPGHPLTHKEVIRPSDLAGHRFVALERQTPLGNLVEDAFRASNVKYDWTISTRYCNTACLLAKAISGVAVVDEYVQWTDQSHRLVTRPFLPSVSVTVCVVYSRHRPLVNVAQHFIKEIEAVFLDNQAARGTATSG